MQTWLVHMRRPGQLLRELGPAGALTFQLLLAGNVLSALVHPLFMAVLAYDLLAQPLRAFGAMPTAALVFAATLLFGYASTIVLDAIGLRRRGLLAHAWVLCLTPAYWFLLALAAWRAVFQLWRDPTHWEKTEHGLAKTSRIAGSRIAPLPGPYPPAAPVNPARVMADSNRAMQQLTRLAQHIEVALAR
jgi:hypothetical protein